MVGPFDLPTQNTINKTEKLSVHPHLTSHVFSTTGLPSEAILVPNKMLIIWLYKVCCQEFLTNVLHSPDTHVWLLTLRSRVQNLLWTFFLLSQTLNYLISFCVEESLKNSGYSTGVHPTKFFYLSTTIRNNTLLLEMINNNYSKECTSQFNNTGLLYMIYIHLMFTFTHMYPIESVKLYSKVLCTLHNTMI